MKKSIYILEEACATKETGAYYPQITKMQKGLEFLQRKNKGKQRLEHFGLNYSKVQFSHRGEYIILAMQ